MSTPATVVVVTHNSAGDIAEVLTALQSDPEGPAEIVVVDNVSTDGTPDIAEGFGVPVVRRTSDDGYGTGCARGAQEGSHDLVFFTPDTRPEPGWLPPLLAALDEPGVGAAMPTIELADRPGHFMSSGGAVSFAGIAWATDVGEPIPGGEPGLVDVPFPSGTVFAIRRATWERVGGMRTDFFLYNEDTDLGWRLALAGLRSVRVPASRVRHDYEFGRYADKLALIERNRRLMIRANYRRSTRLLLAPALALVGLGTLVVAIRDGWWRAWLGAAREARRRADGTWRDRVATGRTVGDAAILKRRTVGLAGISQVRAPRGAGFAAALAGGWVRVVLPLVRLLDRRSGLG